MDATNGWQVVEVTDAIAARARMAPLVAARPVEYSVIASAVVNAAERSVPGEPSRWYFLERGNKPEVVAQQTHASPLYWPIHVPGGPAALAHELVTRRPLLRGVNGDRDAVEAFLDTYLPHTGTAVTSREELGLYDLPVTARLPWPVEGAHTLADRSHRDLLTGWTQCFGEDTGAPLSAGDARALVDRHTSRERLHLWTRSGEPVTMCWVSPPQAGVVRISGVFTPARFRGHGFASALVATVSLREQAEGHTCTLFTQMTNPTSNKIYTALGYRQLARTLNTTLTQ